MKKILFKKIFGLKIMVRRKNSEKMFSRKTFWLEKIWYKKNLGQKRKKIGAEKCLVGKNFVYIKFWLENFFC